MAKLLSAFKRIPNNLPTGVQPGFGVKSFLFDKGERALLGAALGAAKGYYYDLAHIKGIPLEAVVGIAGYLGCALAGGRGGLARHLERAGDAGLTTYVYSIAAAWGAEKAGRGAVLTQNTKALPQGARPRSSMPVQSQQVVGVIPPRSGGAFLSAQEIARGSTGAAR